jgi:Tfp pilus assembly ATPase PilU
MVVSQKRKYKEMRKEDYPTHIPDIIRHRVEEMSDSHQVLMVIHEWERSIRRVQREDSEERNNLAPPPDQSDIAAEEGIVYEGRRNMTAL